MNVTYTWLKEFVDFECTPQELADIMTMLGLEVEGMTTLGGGMDEVIIARVVEKAQHPNADKLSVCKVDTGTEIIDIVCGAQNFVQGDTVALAQVGAVLPGDFKIKRSKIRGEESAGMLCSEKELGLADESAGIMVLSESLALGTPFFEAMALKDTVFEIGLTPNRSDCLSVIGVARDVAAKLGKKIRYHETVIPEYGEPVNSKIAVKLNDSVGCPRYAARYIEGCTIKPSPAWLVNRLSAIGIRSINNVVDITNLIMMEYGQPLHAFDYDQLAGGSIVVRQAADGEIFTTLDGVERTLTAQDLMICDSERPVALAGIMGGLNSEITDGTTRILLESAYFHPPTIRKTSKRLGLHTESSHRFERGTDIDGVQRALDRAAFLIAQLAGGSVAVGVVDQYPVRAVEKTISFRPSRANSLLGLSLSADYMLDLFRRLEFQVTPVGEDRFQVIVPTYRVDIEREVDLIEEICRLHGFDQIPAKLPVAEVYAERLTPYQELQRQTRDHLVSEGMHEVVTFSFIAPGTADRLMLPTDDLRRQCISLCNPLAVEQSVMRTTLVPGLLEVCARNLNSRNTDLQLFEMRRVYQCRLGDDMPHEPVICAGVLTGGAEDSRWCHSDRPIDFYDAKGRLEMLFDWIGLDAVVFDSSEKESFYHPGKCCMISVGNCVIGSLGELHPQVLQQFEIERPVYYFEVNLETISTLEQPILAIRPPSRYPDSVRDLALLAPNDLAAADILACVGGVRIRELEETAIFDVYQGEHVPEGMKSIALRFRYRSAERTLTEEDIQRFHQKIVNALTSRLGLSVRS